MARHGEPQSTPRRIVIEFATESQQKNVLTNAKNLKNYPKWRGVSIKQFLAPHQRKGYKSTKSNDTDPEKEKMKEEWEQMKKQMEALIINQSLQQNQQNPQISPQSYPNMQQQFQQRPGFQAPQGNMQMPPYNPYGGNMTPEMIQMYQIQQNPGSSNQRINQEHSYGNRSGDRLQSRPKPKKTLNILVLGETGVGKSTWINGIANYMTYNTMKEAMDAENPICLISSKFKFYESATRKVEVKIESTHGKKDENELLSDKGESATQDPKTYQFETSKYIVNIIDTPGIGDVRGFNQDKENTRKILYALGEYQEIHAICFLFKANECRLTDSFRFCISELLLQFHKDAVRNIVFFFTNSHASNYKPGDTYVPLKAFLAEIKRSRNLDICLKNENTCCIDNEAFKLVCALANGVNFSDDDIRRYAKSWDHSAKETNRFLDLVDKLPPHIVANTVSVNKARTIILHLAKPLADVNELIESNIKVMNDRKKDLYNTANEMSELKKKLKIPHIGFEVRELNFPRTVCTAEKCVEIELLGNTNQYHTIYKQKCHDHCYLSNVDVEKVAEPHLQGCTAMAGQQNCQVCKCHWSTHMHYRFDQIKTSVEIEDKNTKDLIQKNEGANVIKEQMIKDCENRVAELKEEQQKIIKISLRFGSFLQANAIIPYNDAFEKYVEKTISQEEKCIQFGGDRSKLDNLKKLLAEYRQEKAMLNKAAISSDQDASPISPDEIEFLKEQLFSLNQTGDILKKLFKATEDGIAKNNAHVVVKYVPDNRQKRNRYKSKRR
uniref:AIG1-type G domain-containing protein n=1 Tax=Panagrolaimus davidi TaxID=227884 RepID=A0A914QVJ8_9BILA